MSNVLKIDFIGLKKSKPPLGKTDIIPLSWYQDCYDMELVCIDCLFRWRAYLPITIQTGKINCPECGQDGSIICQP